MSRLPFVAALLALAALGCSDKTGDSADPATTTAQLAGSWAGDLYGHAGFEDDWEEVSYCNGNVTAEVAADGSLEGTGTCQIEWGPAEGEIFVAAFTGSVIDGDVSVDLSLTYDRGTRSWDDATLTGSKTASAINAQSDTRYNPDGLDSVDGRFVLELTR